MFGRETLAQKKARIQHEMDPRNLLRSFNGDQFIGLTDQEWSEISRIYEEHGLQDDIGKRGEVQAVLDASFGGRRIGPNEILHGYHGPHGFIVDFAVFEKTA